MRESALSAHAGQTAFFLMLSFFPFLLFFFSILRQTPFSEEMFSSLVLEFMPDSFRNFMKNIITDIYHSSSVSVISITVISAIWLGSKSFLSVIQGLNAAYGLKESRNYFVLRIFAFLFSLFFALIILLVLGLLVFGNWICTHFFNDALLFKSILGSVIDFRFLISMMILFALFLILYRILPNGHIKFRFHIPGALTASLGWTIFSILYGYYIDRYSNYSSFYGTMTTIALLMVWLYACMYILFLGGVLNHIIHKNAIFLPLIRKRH